MFSLWNKFKMCSETTEHWCHHRGNNPPLFWTVTRCTVRLNCLWAIWSINTHSDPSSWPDCLRVWCLYLKRGMSRKPTETSEPSFLFLLLWWLPGCRRTDAPLVSFPSVYPSQPSLYRKPRFVLYSRYFWIRLLLLTHLSVLEIKFTTQLSSPHKIKVTQHENKRRLLESSWFPCWTKKQQQHVFIFCICAQESKCFLTLRESF